MASPKPFKINVPQNQLDDLKTKLKLVEFPDELEDAAWDYGSPLTDVKRLARAWEEWDWRKAERKLNEYPQFHTDIEVGGFGTLDIHFVHQKSEIKGAIPLLFVHGWPGSFIEVLKILPHLTNPTGNDPVPAFHVVAPSLPNFGFSQGVSKRGFGISQYAETCHNLMQQLGYEQYVTQAGDWGFWITRAIGQLYPQSCRASHLNMVNGKEPTYANEPLLALTNDLVAFDEFDRIGIERRDLFKKKGRGYNILQSTKPQTLAYSLSDSPIGLLAWIYEKLHDWTDSYPWDEEDLLTWISIYQFSRAGPAASVRIYYETFHTPENSFPSLTYNALMDYIPNVYFGLTYNPKDLENVPKAWGRGLGYICYEAENERGGHFYAWEMPELLVRDVRIMFGHKGGAAAVIANRDGYTGGRWGNDIKSHL